MPQLYLVHLTNVFALGPSLLDEAEARVVEAVEAGASAEALLARGQVRAAWVERCEWPAIPYTRDGQPGLRIVRAIEPLPPRRSIFADVPCGPIQVRVRGVRARGVRHDVGGRQRARSSAEDAAHVPQYP
jgi:hypothetical protein